MWRSRLIAAAVVAVVVAGCGVVSGSIDDFKNLEVGDCVSGNVLVEYGWDRIDCADLDPSNMEQFQVTWVGTADDADRMGFIGAAFSGDCLLPVEGDGVVVCFR